MYLVSALPSDIVPEVRRNNQTKMACSIILRANGKGTGQGEPPTMPIGDPGYYIMVADKMKGLGTMRDIYTQIGQGSRIIEHHRNLDIVYKEIREFMRNYNEAEKKHGRPTAIITTIGDCFLMGVAVGYKASKLEKDPNLTPKINLSIK